MAKPKIYTKEDLPKPVKITSRMIDLTNQKFSRLLALYPCGRNSSGDTLWVCKCDCSKNYIIATAHNLRRGRNKSCSSKEDRTFFLQENTYKRRQELNNKIFGYLKVIGFDYVDDSKIFLKCLCLNCNTLCSIRKDVLTSKKIISCGCIKSKGEHFIKKILNNSKIDFKSEYTFNNLKSKKGYFLRFDFAIFDNDNLKCLIEFHGKQHYQYENSGWNTKEHYLATTENDKIKKDYCQKYSIPLYIIKYNQNIKNRMEEILNEL